MSPRKAAGFALITTLVLLALLVLAVFALSALTKVSGEVASTGIYQLQARQNAQLGLAVALGELQQHAGDDDRITGMAGLAGVAAGPQATTRHWCGVWRGDGVFLTWLTSGAVNAISAGSDTIELVSNGTVGAASSTSANVEKQHVIAGKIPLVVPEVAGMAGPVVLGKYAYLVTDEGIKIGAYAPIGQRASSGAAPEIGASMLTNQLKLKTALESNAGRLPEVLTYEQLALLSASLTPSVLQDCFHYVSLTPRFVAGGQYRTGMINLNTSSALVWRSLLDTYNAVPGSIPVTPASTMTNRGNHIGSNFAAAAVGKAANGPFLSVSGFGAYLATIFPTSGTPNHEQILGVLGPMLTVRSDTFRIRGYGEALNPTDDTWVEARASCEAIVQRTPAILPGFGRRFVIVSFRWLGPDDL